MLLVYGIAFFLLVLFSAFFSSAETSLLSINKIRLDHKAKKRNKKAVLLKKILNEPDEFFSTILIGNNLVNIAAASISTIVVSKFLVSDEELILLYSTLFTTIVILVFAEIVPKSYAFRFSDKLSFFYAYPIRFFTYLFYPLVKMFAFFSNILFRKKATMKIGRDLTIEEIKHFLETEIKVFRYKPETLRMVNEIIDITQKDIRSIMTPRMNIVAIEENSDMDRLKQIILEKNLTKIPLYKGNLDCITGIIQVNILLNSLIHEDFQSLNIKKLSTPPIFISEYSSLFYVINQLKKSRLNMGVVIDEYGATIGILTLNDIFREILGTIDIESSPITKVDMSTFVIKGNLPVEEINSQLGLDLPEKKEYTTLSGLFIYFFGKFPRMNNQIRLRNYSLKVKRMGLRKIEEIKLTVDDEE